jgi:hypothetical protein
LRARPEPTQLEPLSDASFLGKLLALSAIVRLNWKVIASYEHSSLFGFVVSTEGKKFHTIDTWRQGYQTLFLRHQYSGKISWSVFPWLVTRKKVLTLTSWWKCYFTFIFVTDEQPK